jgi:hypothetical protein
MIKIAVDSQIAFPRSVVYTTYRDRLIELVPYLPNVRSLQVKSRQETDQRIRIVLEWHGGGDIPAAARALLSEGLLMWTEYDVWDGNAFTVEWRIETHAYREAVFCAGKNHFLEQGNHRTLVESRGELRIDPSKIHGVPSFLIGQLVHLIEEVLAKKIEPNLVQMGQGVQAYLQRLSNS